MLSIAGCGDRPGDAQSGQAKERAPVSAALVPVEERDAERFVEITGSIYGQEEMTISAEVAGRIVALPVDLGDLVAPGSIVASLDPEPYRLAVEEARAAYQAALARLGLDTLPEGEVELGTLPVVVRAEANAANAAARLERARKLFDRTPPLLSEQDFADVQTASDVAKTEVASELLNARALLAEVRVRASELASAERKLRDTTVHAPPLPAVSYRVAARRVSVGEVVAAGTSLFRLVAAERVKIRGMVPERFSNQLAIGATAVVVVEGSTEPVAATITRIAPAVDVATRAFEVEMEADNAAGKLKPGGFARATIGAGVDPNVRCVPRSCIVQFAGVQRVYSVRDKKIAEHRVRPGRSLGELVEIEGLPVEVTEVVADPPRGLAAGAAVTVEAGSN